MMGEILLGIFGNSIYDIIKAGVKDSFNVNDEDIISRIYCALEKASKSFFDKYNDEFGCPSSSFLARQANIDLIVKSIFYDDNSCLTDILSKEGFDGEKDVSVEALNYFVINLNNAMMEDFRLNKIITEKKHIAESRETSTKIMDMLTGLIKQEQLPNSDEKNSDNWIMKDAQGNKVAVIEGKQYVQRFSNGIEISYMFKNGLIYVEMLDAHKQKSYYELDVNGNVKGSKFPYELSEYTLIIPEEQIVNKNVIYLPNGFRREVIKLKWDKQADVVFDKDGKLQSINLHGGWEVKNREKIIQPKA